MSTLTRLLPHPRALAGGFRDSLLLASWRWRIIRRPSSRIVIVLAALAFVFGLYFAASVGQFIRLIAETERDGSTAGLFALNYVIAFERDDFGPIAAIALGSALAASLFAPLTGAASLALASPEDLSGLRLHRLHRYFDSVLVHAVSTIGLLQMLALTAVASLLTLEGTGRGYALAVTWAVWVTLILVGSVEGWLVEYIYRRYGVRTRRLIILVVLAVIAAAVWIDPDDGTTLFGIGTLYAEVLQDRAGLQWWMPFAVLAGVNVLLLVVGAAICQSALNRPAAIVTRRNDVRARELSTQGRRALQQLMWRQMRRSPEVYRPILTIILIGVPAVWITQGNTATMTTLLIAVPLAVCLAMGVNFFGVVGTAMSWLAAQPKALAWLLHVAGLNMLLVMGVITVLLWAPMVASGLIPLASGGALAAGAVVTSSLATRSSLSKAIHHPYPVRLGARGESLVPPLAAINYTMRLTLWAGQLGILVMVQGQWVIQLALATACALWAYLRYRALVREWGNRVVQTRVIGTVATG